MGIQLADFCYCIRETFLFFSPFVKKQMQNEGELLAMLQELTTEDEKKAKDLKEFLELLK